MKKTITVCDLCKDQHVIMHPYEFIIPSDNYQFNKPDFITHKIDLCESCASEILFIVCNELNEKQLYSVMSSIVEKINSVEEESEECDDE